jgi:hypothetical protein
MGQYWLPVNLDKKEFIDPHKLGVGLKLWEQVGSFPGTGAALLILCAAMPEARGGGDLDNDDEVAKRTIGRWAGDRVALIGDYAEQGDIKRKKNDPSPSLIYHYCQMEKGDEGYDPKKKWKDVSDDVCAVIEQVCDGKFSGTGWRQFDFNGGQYEWREGKKGKGVAAPAGEAG